MQVVKMQKDVYKQLMKFKRGMLLLLLAEIMQIALIYLPDFSNKIDEIATFVTSGIIAGIVYSYFTEKNRIINHKTGIYIDKNAKKMLFIVSIIAGIIVGLITFITRSIIISGILAIIFLIAIIIYFHNESNVLRDSS